MIYFLMTEVEVKLGVWNVCVCLCYLEYLINSRKQYKLVELTISELLEEGITILFVFVSINRLILCSVLTVCVKRSGAASYSTGPYV